MRQLPPRGPNEPKVYKFSKHLSDREAATFPGGLLDKLAVARKTSGRCFFGPFRFMAPSFLAQVIDPDSKNDRKKEKKRLERVKNGRNGAPVNRNLHENRAKMRICQLAGDEPTVAATFGRLARGAAADGSRRYSSSGFLIDFVSSQPSGS
ncbi:unnamed protein product [Caenorhabditis auriculariae]|uniref:Uncharacterized protein n=1 Tax=Caenorhabditis auriculariae TaxID=2777116 RepID=A0A8S1H7Z4_9PELO|nr:unnamed protein product [Caenorhabditis auriculariae]